MRNQHVEGLHRQRAQGIRRTHRRGVESRRDRSDGGDRQGTKEGRPFHAAELWYFHRAQDQGAQGSQPPHRRSDQGESRQDCALQGVPDAEEGRLKPLSGPGAAIAFRSGSWHQMSISSTLLAWSWMNWKRSSGLRPIRLSTTRFVSARSSGRATTFSRVRRFGSIVVSFSADGGISPNPLNRLISIFAPALNALFICFSRSASFIA